MSENSAVSEKFTGLILLTGKDEIGIANSLFTCLSQFSIEIIDVEQLVISGRLVLTVLITLNPAHERAIEDDLNALAAQSGLDIAMLCGKKEIERQKDNLISVLISKKKLHPMDLQLITDLLKDSGSNIESIQRVGTQPTQIEIKLSGTTLTHVQTSLARLNIEGTTTVNVRQT